MAIIEGNEMSEREKNIYHKIFMNSSCLCKCVFTLFKIQCMVSQVKVEPTY